ncbi:DMT family transporter [Selenihalanaerobacter shriftii]|uniref:Threonine/homoserine efflux transporter RhtA n=1 Tax=Selenihalanaerobacter shriftii TaxID=142842 RepID=A0A1T4NCV5_9FIRM|nr:DMT family transporter [Selenihalanaerobacter shriftii]SJZ77131.1 Threonine/homoserine efflux transporter RhtA [Selenihalanaerobacter shriftii]
MYNSQEAVESKDTKIILFADLALLLVAMVWGGGFVVTKNLLDTMGPFYFLGIRFTISALILGIIFWKRVRKIELKVLSKGLLIGLFLFLAFATQTVGLIYTTPAKQGFITGINVVIVPFLYMFVTKKMISKQSLIGAVLATIGLSLISFQEGILAFNIGDLLTLFCAFFFAAHIVAIGILVKKVDPINLTIIQLAFTGVLSIVIAVFKEPMPVLSVDNGLIGLGYMILLSSIFAFLAQNVAQKFTFSTHAAILLSLESVFGALFSWVFWGEQLTIKFIIGACIVLVGIIIAELRLEEE